MSRTELNISRLSPCRQKKTNERVHGLDTGGNLECPSELSGSSLAAGAGLVMNALRC